MAPSSGRRDLAELPLSGKTSDGQRWRLQPYRPVEADDVRPSWCLRLRYATGASVDGDPYGGGLATCGRRPARRVDGVVAIDCSRRSVFVFGGARSAVRSVGLWAAGKRVAPTRYARLPPRSHFSGYTFLVVGRLPEEQSRIVARGAGQRVLARLPRRSKICAGYPGAPEGGEPLLAFRSRQ
jgi:hypothetical protein